MALSEQIVMNAHREGHYIATHFRYTKVYGPRELAPTEWCIIRRVLDGRKQLILPCGGLNIQSRLYAENAAHALLLAVDHTKEAAGKIYNVSDDRLLSLRRWVDIVMNALGEKMELIDMPYPWARPSYPYIRIYIPSPQLGHWMLSNAKIKAELGYQDVVSPEKAIRRTVAWLLRNRLERDGEQEKAIGDPFDYAAEDRLIEEYRKAEPRIMAVPFTGFAYRHPYAHPKRPEE
jgi:nucleoside-diphosphate-sugar epimerase